MILIDAEVIKNNSGINIISYINGLEYNKTQLSQEISNLGNSLSSLILSNYTYVNAISFQHIFQTTDDNKEEICKLLIDFQIYNMIDRYELEISRDGTYIDNLADILNLILDGCYAINKVNTKVKSIQDRNGTSLAIIYKWGVDNKCSISDWDYDTIKVRLSKVALLHMIELIQSEDYINSLIEKNDWDYTIKRYIEDFDKIELHKKVDAILESETLTDILLKNMIQVKDIEYIINIKQFNGNLELKVVEHINELGNFLVLSKWDIDTENSIRVELYDNKVLDIDNDKIIVNSDLIDRIYNKISKEAELISKNKA